MPQRYTVQDLLQLRESPLVKKPDNLPPAEQWMGPPVDPAQRRPAQGRNRTDEPSSNELDKRPSLLETHVTRRSTTVTENIVLGPPKTAFASSTSTRTLGKAGNYDSNDITSTENQSLTGRGIGKEHDGDERDGDRRGGKFGAMNGRRTMREDREDWGNRPRRTFDGEDNERRPRRNGDREGQRWERTSREHNELGDETRRDNRDEGRFGQRQGQGRARFEQPWFRGENGGEGADDSNRNQMRQRGWVRDRRSGGPDNEWNSRPEQDPEWMDAPEPEDQKQAHTAEDFQKWKERMKADNDKRTPTVEAQQSLEHLSLEDKEPASKVTQVKLKPEADKFFELYGEKKVQEEVTTVGIVDAKKHKTRFAALFSPSVEVASPAELRQPPSNASPQETARPASTDADQEGFQRILAMLGGKAPKTNASPMDALFGGNAGANRPEQQAPNPLAGLFGGDNFSKAEGKPMEKPQSRNSGGLESLLGPRSPKISTEKKNDSDFLLRLMQQSKVSPSPPAPQNSIPQPNHTPGILQMPEILNRSRPSMRSPNELPAFFDEPPINNGQRLPPREVMEERQRFAGRPQIPADIVYEKYGYGKGPQDFPPNQPGPMPRPPGLEGMPPPSGWPYPHQQFPPTPGGHGPLHPPPGISNPGPRGIPFPPGPPMPQNMPMPSGQPGPPPPPPPQDRQRKYPSGNAGPFLPPGMQPPPGFMGMPGGGPPPGFPPMPMGGNEAMMGMGQQGMPPRHLMELFAMTGGERVGGAAPTGRAPGNGAGIPPGAYR